MIPIENWVHTRVAAAIGWTLFHSLWEGAIIALVLALALRLLRAASGRYGAACGAMLLLLAASGVTFVQVMPGAAKTVRIEASQTFAVARGTGCVAEADWCRRACGCSAVAWSILVRGSVDLLPASFGGIACGAPRAPHRCLLRS